MTHAEAHMRPRPHGQRLERRRQARPRPARNRPARVRLWLPLTPLWVVLAPFALLLAPLMTLAPEARGVRPYRAAFAIGAVLMSLSGTVVDVEAPGALVKIRIF